MIGYQNIRFLDFLHSLHLHGVNSQSDENQNPCMDYYSQVGQVFLQISQKSNFKFKEVDQVNCYKDRRIGYNER